MKAIHNYYQNMNPNETLFSKSKDTIMKAIHNYGSLDRVAPSAVFKEQRYDNESNSQPPLELSRLIAGCFQRAKIR